MTWFPLPLQNAMYTAIYEQWVFRKDNDTLGMVLYTRPEDTNTEDWAGYELLHRMHHWSRAYAHLTHMVIVPLQDVEAAPALQVQVNLWVTSWTAHSEQDAADETWGCPAHERAFVRALWWW